MKWKWIDGYRVICSEINKAEWLKFVTFYCDPWRKRKPTDLTSLVLALGQYKRSDYHLFGSCETIAKDSLTGVIACTYPGTALLEKIEFTGEIAQAYVSGNNVVTFRGL